jgi:hypothetical protein
MKARRGRAWVFAILLFSICTVASGQSTATQETSGAAGSGFGVQNEANRAAREDKSTTDQPGKDKLILEGVDQDAAGGAVRGVDATPSGRSGSSRATGTGSGAQVGFWSLQGLMFASAIAAAETTHNCIQAGSCTAIPVQFRTRTAMYNAGLPVAAGIAILSYEMKKHGNRWWYLPSVVVVAADGLLAVHSARASH